MRNEYEIPKGVGKKIIWYSGFFIKTGCFGATNERRNLEKPNTNFYSHPDKIYQCSTIASLTGIIISFIPSGIISELSDINYFYFFSIPLLTNYTSGVYESYRYKKRKMQGIKSEIEILDSESMTDNLEDKIDNQEPILNPEGTLEEKSDFINPWEIDIPKLDNKLLKNYSEGYN